MNQGFTPELPDRDALNSRLELNCADQGMK